MVKITSLGIIMGDYDSITITKTQYSKDEPLKLDL